MKEVITVQIGNCGITMGLQFWAEICNEHSIIENGQYTGNSDFLLERIQSFFNEVRGMTFCPRSIMVDLDKSSIDTARASQYGALFKPESFIFSDEGGSNIWGKGHYSEGAELCATLLDLTRKEVENCDCFHGFQIMHGVGGGTGGGLGSLYVKEVKDEYPDRILTTYSMLPSADANYMVVEPYNSILSLNHLIEYTNQTYCFDNGALSNMAVHTLKKNKPTFDESNHLIAMGLSGITAGLRFQGPSNTNFRKICVNTIPFPRLHFFVSSYAPLISRGNIPQTRMSVLELTRELFNQKNMYCTCNIKQGVYLTAGCLFRGQLSPKEIDRQMYNVQNKNSTQFVEWIPNNIKAAICSIPPKGLPTAASFIGNSTAVREVFENCIKQYLVMYKKKSYLHWSTGEGVDPKEMEVAESNIKDLISEYEKYEKEKLTPTIRFDNCQT